MLFDDLKRKVEGIAPGVIFAPDNLVTDEDYAPIVIKLPGANPGEDDTKIVYPHREGGSDPLVDDEEAKVIIEWVETRTKAKATP